VPDWRKIDQVTREALLTLEKTAPFRIVPLRKRTPGLKPRIVLEK
jgi:hypothetical protein